jgi:hypothetical protein
VGNIFIDGKIITLKKLWSCELHDAAQRMLNARFL